MKRRGELRMIERAIRQGWDTPPAQSRRAIEFVFEVLDDPAVSTREQAAALRCLEALIQQDVQADSQIRKRANDALRYHETKLESITK